MTINIVYLAIVAYDFFLAEWLFDNCLFEFFHKNEKLLHDLFKKMRKVFENTIYYYLKTVKDLCLALVSGVLPLLPDAIRAPLDLIGVSAFLESSLNKY